MNWMKWKGTTPYRQTPTISSWRNSNERPLTSTYLPINRDRYGSNTSRPGTINMNRKPYRISRNLKEVSKEAEKGEDIGNEFIGGVIPLNKQIDMSLYKSPKVENNGQKEEDFWLVSPKTGGREKSSLGLSQLAKFKNSIERTKAGTDERYYTNTIEYDEEITKTKEEEKNDSYNDSCDKLPFEIYSDLVTKGFNKTKDQGKLFNYVQLTYEPEPYVECNCLDYDRESDDEREKKISTVVRPMKSSKRPHSLIRNPGKNYDRKSINEPDEFENNPKTPKEKFRCVSLAMLKSKGQHCENRKITRRTRGEKGGVIDFAVDDINKRKYVITDPKKKQLNYMNKELYPEIKGTSCRTIQKWWRALKRPHKDDTDSIIKIQSALRGYNVRKNLYRLFALALYHQTFGDKINNAMSHYVRRVYFPLIFGKKATIRDALLRLIKDDHYLLKHYFLLWKDKVHKLKLRDMWMNALLSRKGNQMDNMETLEKYFNRWRLGRDIDEKVKKANDDLLQQVKATELLVEGVEKMRKKKGLRKVAEPIKQYLDDQTKQRKKKKLRPVIIKQCAPRPIDIEKYFNRWRLGRDINGDIRNANDELMRKIRGMNIILHGSEKAAKRDELDTTKEPLKIYLKSMNRQRRQKSMRPIIHSKIEKEEAPIDIEKYFNRWRLGRDISKDIHNANEDLLRRVKGAHMIINGSEAKGNKIFFDNAKQPLKLYLLNRIKENRTKKLRPIFQRLEKKFDIEKYFNRWRLNKPKRNMEEELIRKINGTNDMVDNTYLMLKQYFFNQSQDPLKDFLSSKIRVKRLKKMRPIVKRKTKPIDIEKYFNRWRLKPDLNEQLIRKIKGMNIIVKGSEDLHKRIDFVNVEKPLKRYLYNIILQNRRRKLRAIVNHYDKEFDIEKYFNRWRLGRDISKDIKDANEELLRKMKGFNIILLNTEKTAKQSSLDTAKPPVEDYLMRKIKVTRTKRMRPIVKRKIQPIDIEKYFNRWRLGRDVDSEKAQAEDALKRKIKGINLLVNGGDKKGQRVGLDSIKDKLMKYFGTVIRTRRVKIIRPIVKKKDKPIDIEKYFNRWRLGRDVDGERNKAEEAIRRRIKGTNLIIYGVNKTAKRKGLKSAYPQVKKYLLPKIFGKQIKHLKLLVMKYEKTYDIEKYFIRWRLGRDSTGDINKEKENLLRKIKGANLIVDGSEEDIKRNALDKSKAPLKNYLLKKIRDKRAKRLQPIVNNKHLRDTKYYFDLYLKQIKRQKDLERFINAIDRKANNDNRRQLLNGLRWIGRIRTLKFLLREIAQYNIDKNLGYYFEKWRENSAYQTMLRIVKIQKWIRPLLIALKKKRALRKKDLLKNILRNKQINIDLIKLLLLKRWKRITENDKLTAPAITIQNATRRFLSRKKCDDLRYRLLKQIKNDSIEYKGKKSKTVKNSPQLVAKYLTNFLQKIINRINKETFDTLKAPKPITPEQKFKQIVNKRIIHNTTVILNEVSITVNLFYLLKVVRINKNYAKRRFIHEVILIWRLYTKQVQKKRKNMKAMYEKMNILYLQMADSLFGQGDNQDPSIPSALNHFQDKRNNSEPQTKEMKELEELRRKKNKMFIK